MRRFAFNDSIKKATTLITGTSVSQLLPIVFAPVLTRIFSPESFGEYSVYLALVMIFTLVASGRYELSIIMPKNHMDSKKLMGISLIICFLFIFFSGFVLSILFIFSDFISLSARFDIYFLALVGVFLASLNQISDFISLSARFDIYFLALVGVFLASLNQIFYFWMNRESNYKIMSIARVLQTAFSVGMQLLFGISFLMTGSGLIFGSIIGLFISNIFYLYILRKEIFTIRYEKREFPELIKEYKNFPLILLPSHLLGMFSRQLPLLISPMYFGLVSTGFLGLIMRVITLPSHVISSSFGDVFREEGSKAFIERGECEKEYLSTLRNLVTISLIPFLLFWYFSPKIFPFIFGIEWQNAGILAQIMAPMFFFQFISSPLSNMYIIAEKQRYDLILNIIIFLMTVLSFYIGISIYKDISGTLFLYSLCYSVVYVFNLLITYNFSRGR